LEGGGHETLEKNQFKSEIAIEGKGGGGTGKKILGRLFNGPIKPVVNQCF